MYTYIYNKYYIPNSLFMKWDTRNHINISEFLMLFCNIDLINIKETDLILSIIVDQ